MQGVPSMHGVRLKERKAVGLARESKRDRRVGILTLRVPAPTTHRTHHPPPTTPHPPTPIHRCVEILTAGAGLVLRILRRAVGVAAALIDAAAT